MSEAPFRPGRNEPARVVFPKALLIMSELRQRAVGRSRRPSNEPTDGCLWRKVLGGNSLSKEESGLLPAAINDRWFTVRRTRAIEHQ
jgi:hypothetical protein